MGSSRHHAEEGPARFVEATGYVTFAEVPPDPKDYPGALPEMLNAASLVCRRYRPAARHAQPVDTSTSHVGFRLVSHAPGP